MGFRQKWESENRAQTNDLHVRPVLAWLEVQAGGLAEFHAGVERWIQRLRWFRVEGDDEEGFYRRTSAGYLVVVATSGERLELPREARAADGVELLVRVAEVRPPSPTRDHRTVVSLKLADLGLLPR